jgi:hypothetical protein
MDYTIQFTRVASQIVIESKETKGELRDRFLLHLSYAT